MPETIPVVDIFAGPGGLAEGFASARRRRGAPGFRIVLSIEKDHHAHQTLELRSFFRQFSGRPTPAAYYRHLRGQISRDELFARFPDEAQRARAEAWHLALDDDTAEQVDQRMRESLAGVDDWVLVGGPPCQAYSIVGRARNRGIDPDDHRVYLYHQYIRLLAEHEPPVFVLENVKGLLSSTLDGSSIFDPMLADLRRPANAATEGAAGAEYRIFSFVQEVPPDPDASVDPTAFVIRSEEFGVPQTRHRVILLGVRKDRAPNQLSTLLRRRDHVSLREAMKGIPRIRSGLPGKSDSGNGWVEILRKNRTAAWLTRELKSCDRRIHDAVLAKLDVLSAPRADRGDEFVAHAYGTRGWLRNLSDARIGGVCNHSSRSHMTSDLARYLFVSSFALVHDRSPRLHEFPEGLLPSHANISEAVNGGKFADRFRVQVWSKPSKTVTSHISKDGHYFIHPDPTQCRSLTVREAARLQTFPDNYFFCGPRTSQYVQVGNAVPPLLARQLASVVAALFPVRDRRAAH